MVEHRNFENWSSTWPIALKIWKRKFANFRDCGIPARHFRQGYSPDPRPFLAGCIWGPDYVLTQRRECKPCKLMEVRIRPLLLLVISVMKLEWCNFRVSKWPCQRLGRRLLLFQKGFLWTTYPCITGAQESAQLSRLFDVLPSLCENTVNSGLTWSFSRWSDSSAYSIRMHGAMKTKPTPGEPPISVLSHNSHIMVIRFGAIWSTIFHGFGLHGWICASVSWTLQAMDMTLAPLDTATIVV